MKTYLYRNYWNGLKRESVTFPKRWRVETLSMHGADRKKASNEKIRAAIRSPAGTRPLRETARGSRDAVIVFDDISRPTRIDRIAPFIIEELLAGGIKRDDIRFVCALGAHGALTAAEFRMKLGPDIVKRFKVYNHNPFINCEHIGSTARGTKVSVNSEVLGAGIKIGIGCILPHQLTGFSGGGKLFMPGVAAIETIEQNHRIVTSHGSRSAVYWKERDNVVRAEINEALGMIGVDFMVNVLVNGRGETVEIYAGDHGLYRDAAVKEAKRIYATPPLRGRRRVVILNALLKSNEVFVTSLLGRLSLREDGGTIIVVADSPAGQVTHYLTGSFGKRSKARLYFTSRCPENLERMVILSDIPEKAAEDWFGAPRNGIIWTNSWERAIREAEKGCPEGKIDAVVFPNAAIQYYPDFEVVFRKSTSG